MSTQSIVATRPVLETKASHLDSTSCRAARICWGVPIGFEAHTSEWLTSLTNVIPGIPCSSQSALWVNFSIRQDDENLQPRRYEVPVNGTSIRKAMSAERVLTFIERHAPEAVAVLTPSFVLVHAAVVGWQGRAVLLPGSSWSGKTTLALALVEAGATYYSDEYAIIDRHANVHSYLRPPHVRIGPSSEVVNRLTNALSRGLPSPPPLPIGLVLMSRYSENGVWNPRPPYLLAGAV